MNGNSFDDYTWPPICENCNEVTENGYYFRPIDCYACPDCRKANKHLMTIGDTWDELMIKWSYVQPWWMWQIGYWAYLIWKKGLIGAYRHRKEMSKIYEQFYK